MKRLEVSGAVRPGTTHIWVVRRQRLTRTGRLRIAVGFTTDVKTNFQADLSGRAV